MNEILEKLKLNLIEIDPNLKCSVYDPEIAKSVTEEGQKILKEFQQVIEKGYNLNAERNYLQED